MSELCYCYESFTSDLKVWAERSPLSKWSELTIVKKLRFKIVFNRAKPQVIRGDRYQLETLIVGISSYVDTLLNSLDSGIKLRHRCFIPNFRAFSLLEFSTLELFDLHTNLELLTNEVIILPSLDSASTLSLDFLSLDFKDIKPIWLKVAAAAIATVGLTTSIRFLLPAESPTYVISSNSTETIPKSDPKTELKPNPKPLSLKGSENSSQPQAKLEPKTSLKDNSASSTQKSLNSDNLGNLSQSQPKLSRKEKPSVQPLVPEVSILRNPSVSKQSSQILPSIPEPSITKPSQVPEQPSIASDSIKIAPPKVSPTNPSTNGITNEARDRSRLRQKANPTLEINPPAPSPQTFNQPPLQTLRRDSDRRSNSISKPEESKDKNSKIEVDKISGSVNPQDLKTYKQKIESLSTLKLSEETDIEVRWLNREITEIKILPQNPELTEFIRRSLLETFSDLDGNISITLKAIGS